MKSEVAKELPPKIRSVIPVTITNRHTYDQAEGNFLQWVGSMYGEDAAQRCSGAIGLTKLGMLKRIAAEGKMEPIKIWIKDFLETTDEKLVVFCYHRKIMAMLKEMFPTGANIYGGMTAKKREFEKQQFLTNDDCRLLFGQFKSAGIGLDGLHRVSSTVLFAEIGWNFSEHEQNEDRVLRLGQLAERVMIYYMIARNTVEEDIMEVIQNKDDICNQILQGKINEIPLFKNKLKGI
jgi:SWI/SNF-related matrix-associated actin-dependent regulator 1 of chromatin subfamily A